MKSASTDSAIKNFFDIHSITTKFGYFSPNVLENKILEKNCVMGIFCCLGNTKMVQFCSLLFRSVLFYLFFRVVLICKISPLIYASNMIPVNR